MNEAADIDAATAADSGALEPGSDETGQVEHRVVFARRRREIAGIRGVGHSSDSSVVLGERTVLILAAATGRERARLTDFTRPTDVEFKEKPPSPTP